MKVLNRVIKHTFFIWINLLITQKYVSLHCVFHSIRFKVNKGWSKALLLFLCPYPGFLFRVVFISPASVRIDKPVLPPDCLYVFPRHPIV